MINKALFPHYFALSAYALDYYALWRRGIRALVFDLDNTIAPFDVALPGRRARRLFRLLSAMGFKLCFLSNNKGRRVKAFADALGCGVLVVGGARKPSTKGLTRAMGLMGVDKTETAIIGDQVFTDVLCGRLAGVFTVLTRPLCNRDEWTVKLKRPFEKPVLWALRRRLRRG